MPGPRRLVTAFAAAATLCALAAPGTVAPAPGRAQSAAPAPSLPAGAVEASRLAAVGPPPRAADRDRPDIVLILTDDLDVATFARMPVLRRELTARGTTFDRTFVTDSLCCPSRSSILRGQYVHNHGIVDNHVPDGGYGGFQRRRLERSTVATWLDDAGYRTGFLGKYLNEYPRYGPRGHAPPGWDDWHAGAWGAPYRQFGYTMVENGRLVRYGHQPRDYGVDVLARKAERFIRRGRDGEPFFLYVAPFVPHTPATPAPRHAAAYADVRAPRTAGYNPAHQGGPLWLRLRPRLDADEIALSDHIYRQRLRSMLGVQDMVSRVLAALRETGRLDRTYVVFTSDNGFLSGQHRIPHGKRTAFDESIRVPLVVRGPGVAAGRTVSAVASTVDLAPTFAALAGARVPSFVDGRSLVPFLRGRNARAWRDGVLVERDQGETYGPWERDLEQAIRPSWGAMPSYAALRTARHTYVEYRNGDRELYDDVRDPQQLDDLATSADPALVRRLSAMLRRLTACSGPSCREADRLLSPEPRATASTR